MNERPMLYFALGVLVTTSIGSVQLRNDGIGFPDGTVQTTAASPVTDTRRAFYLADDTSQIWWDGAEPLGACDEGFHMASLWEILDPGNLRYVRDEELSPGHSAVRRGDSGMGPPAASYGWVRTGWDADIAADGAGVSNCQAWTTDETGFGSTAGLNPCWETDDNCASVTVTTGNQAARWWITKDATCTLTRPVWCVQD